MDSLLRDLRVALRSLRRHRGFSVAALLTLALAVGTNTALFGVIYAVLLRPLPFPQPEQLVFVYNGYPNAGASRAGTSIPDYLDRREETQLFDSVSLYDTRGATLEIDGTPQRLTAMEVTPSFFTVLRTGPRLGRAFSEEEGQVGNHHRVVLSHDLWQRVAGGDTAVVGRDLRLNGELHQVVGVMPRGFQFMDPDVELWMPLTYSVEEQSEEARHNSSADMVARLAPGVSLHQVQARLDAMTQANLERIPTLRKMLEEAGYHTQAVALGPDLVREVRQPLLMLWLGVLAVLLIACVNLANLSLVRANVRLREMATRRALGAGPWRLARQLMAEGLWLGAVAGGLGLALGMGGLELLQRFGAARLPRGTELGLELATIGYGLLLSLGVALGLAMIPLVVALGVKINTVLRDGGRSGTSRRANLMRRGLVSAQVAAALMLLLGAGLLLASFSAVLSIDPGYRSAGVVTGNIVPSSTEYPEAEDLRQFSRQLLSELGKLPGVSAAGISDTLPMAGGVSSNVVIPEGYDYQGTESLVSPDWISISPGYLETMGTPLLEGRLFEARDTDESTRVALIDERLSQRLWPESSAVGQRFFVPASPDDLLRSDAERDWVTVVGVVGNMQLGGLLPDRDDVGTYYYPLEQVPSRGLGLAVRAAAPGVDLGQGLRRAVQALDADLPVFAVSSLDRRLQTSLQPRRGALLLALVFASLALFLSALGLYGVLAYAVVQRTREIGIRMALGGRGQDILGMVLKEGVALVAMGVAVGLAGAVVLRQAIQSQLYGVRPLEPAVLVAATATLAGVALIACLVPARRAAAVDPARALADE